MQEDTQEHEWHFCPRSAKRLFLIKYKGEKSCKLRLELKSIQWGGQEEVTSLCYQQNDAGRRWSN